MGHLPRARKGLVTGKERKKGRKGVSQYRVSVYVFSFFSDSSSSSLPSFKPHGSLFFFLFVHTSMNRIFFLLLLLLSFLVKPIRDPSTETRRYCGRDLVRAQWKKKKTMAVKIPTTQDAVWEAAAATRLSGPTWTRSSRRRRWLLLPFSSYTHRAS